MLGLSLRPGLKPLSSAERVKPVPDLVKLGSRR
jgi:hypothetical protein